MQVDLDTGILCARVRRDGANSTRVLADTVRGSRFHRHLQVIMLQGIAFGGVNVTDIHGLHQALGLPVLVVCAARCAPGRSGVGSI